MHGYIEKPFINDVVYENLTVKIDIEFSYNRQSACNCLPYNRSANSSNT